MCNLRSVGGLRGGRQTDFEINKNAAAENSLGNGDRISFGNYFKALCAFFAGKSREFAMAM